MKTLEEIKNEYAINMVGSTYKDWDEMEAALEQVGCKDWTISRMHEVAKRYAEAALREAANKVWYEGHTDFKEKILNIIKELK